MINENKLQMYQDIIDKLLLQNSLTKNELGIVDNDQDFQIYLKEFNLIEKGIAYSVMKSKYQFLIDHENNKYAKDLNKESGILRKSLIFAIAASILLLLGYITFNGSSSKTYNGQLLASKTMVPYAMPNVSRSNDDITKNDPYYNYSKRNYPEAINDFQKLIESDNNPKYKFYLAVSYLYVKNWEKAESILSNQELAEIGYPVNFYLAIAKVGLKKTNEAVELLQKPLTDDILYNEEGQKLLKELKKYL